MPLPENPNMAWPPETWADVFADYEEWSAWYSGDPARLASVYSKRAFTPTPRGRFWAKDTFEERRVMLHVPVAGDIAAVSASLLFSEPAYGMIPEAHGANPSSEAKATQDRLEEIMDAGGIHNRLLEAAETCAAMGGVFLKPTWDKSLAPRPILSIAQADAAIPEFRFGILTAVTFFREFPDDTSSNVVWRHLERHEPGLILNGLYRGSQGQLGRRMPLTAHPETAGLPDMIDVRQVLGIDGLICRYVPNRLPNRKHRGVYVGMSDYSGVEGFMDALDEAYTSWLRDIRLGQGRLFVPSMFLDSTGAFDLDKEVYTVLDIDPMSLEKLGSAIKDTQFAIRTEEHYRTCLEWMDRIVTHAGYSPQTFGLKIEGRAESGKALHIRERKTFTTKGMKERYWKPAVEDILQIMLVIDKQVFGTPDIDPNLRPTLEFSDSIAFDLTEVAEAIEVLSRAHAISIQTAVEMAHPEWGEEEVAAEVQRIMRERGMAVEDPMQAGMLP